MLRRAIVRTSLMLSGLATVVWAQQDRPLIRVDVNVVQVEVVVTDGKGRQVPGLRPEDFQLQVDGKDKAITHFSMVDTGPAKTPLPGSLPRLEEVHRTVVFMIDEVHTSPENLAQLV